MRETRHNMTLCIFSPIVYVYSLLRRSLIVRCSNTYINRSECRHVYRVCKTVSANNFEVLENNCNVGGESTRLPSETNTLFTQSLYHHVVSYHYIFICDSAQLLFCRDNDTLDTSWKMRVRPYRFWTHLERRPLKSPRDIRVRGL